jgi:hypothetical protein
MGLHRFFENFTVNCLKRDLLNDPLSIHLFSHWSLPFKLLFNSIHLEKPQKRKIAHFCCLFLQAGDDYQYVYDTSEVVKPEKSGQRLIGASRGEHTKIPFIVVWHSTATDEEGPNVQCSGTILFSIFTQSSVYKGISLIEEHIAEST